jgi:hypothetical protein
MAMGIKMVVQQAHGCVKYAGYTYGSLEHFYTHDNFGRLLSQTQSLLQSILFVFTRPGGTHDRCFQPVTHFLPSLGQNPPVP